MVAETGYSDMDEEERKLELNSPDSKRFALFDYMTSETGGEVGENSTVIEMLNQIKSLREDNHRSYHAEIRQVADESNETKQT